MIEWMRKPWGLQIRGIDDRARTRTRIAAATTQSHLRYRTGRIFMPIMQASLEHGDARLTRIAITARIGEKVGNGRGWMDGIDGDRV